MARFLLSLVMVFGMLTLSVLAVIEENVDGNAISIPAE